MSDCPLHEGDLVVATGAEDRPMTVDILSEGLELAACRWLESGKLLTDTFPLDDLRLVGPRPRGDAPAA